MLLAIIVSLFVAVQDPIIQKFAVRFAGGYLSEKTGADIKVGRLAVTPGFYVFLDDVTVKDLKGNDLAKIGKLRGKVFVGELLEGKVHLGHVRLRDAEANLMQYEGEEDFNFKFLADFFSSDKEKEPRETPFSLLIDEIDINNLDFVLWNQNKDNPEKIEQKAMDYAHLDLDSICLSAKNLQLVGDSVHAVIEMLRGKEMSGIEIKTLQSDVIVSQSGIRLTDLQMETNNSLIHTDLNMLYNGYQAFNSFVDSVRFDATIYPTDLLLSDIGVFAPVMYQMPDRVFFEGRFTGPIEHFTVSDIDAQLGKSTSLQGNISMHPLDFENGEHELNVKKFKFTYDDVANFRIPGRTVTVPIPESLSAMHDGNAQLDFKGSYNNFISEIHLLSDIGNVDLNVARERSANGDNLFTGNIVSEGIDVGGIVNASKFVGSLDLDADFAARFPHDGNLDLNVDGKAYHAELLGNHIDEIVLNGELKENRFKGKVTVDDDELGLDFDGLIDFKDKKYPKADFNAVVSHADLSALHLMKNDSVSEVSTRIVANLKGFNLDDLEGELHLDSTTYRNGRGSYFMRDFDASITDDNLMQRRIKVNNDFFDFEMAGKMNFAALMPVLNEYGESFVHFPQWETDHETFRKYKLKHDVEQDFVVSLNLKDSKTLCRLLMPNLKIANNTTVNGTFTSKSNQLNLTTRSKGIQIGDVAINDVELRNFNMRDAAFGMLSIGGVSYTHITSKDTLDIGLDNLLLSAKMANDTIAARIVWDDMEEEDHNKALVEASFHPLENGGIVNIGKADLVINDSLWQVSPSNFIEIDGKRVTLSNLMFSHERQSLRVDGYAPMNEGDTLSVQFRSFDVSNFDKVFASLGFDADGLVSGDALVSNLKNDPMVLADLAIDGLGMNGDRIGDAIVSSQWDNETQGVGLDASILNDNQKNLSAYGSYYPNRKDDNLDFTVDMDSLRLAVLSPFVAGAVSRLQGYGNGSVTVTGSLKQPDIKGQVSITDGGCKIGYLNTFYTFSPTILIDSQTIELKNCVLTDTLGNHAIAEGRINHDHLKDFNLDFKLHPHQFLALATSAKDNDTFYGSAIADGLIVARGPFNDIHLSIKALTRKGTKITIPIGHSNTVKDNDFIVFVQPPDLDEEEEEEALVEEEAKKSNLTLNLDFDVTDEAELHIVLPGIGNLDATGNGNVKLGSSNATNLSLIGDYAIKNGRFQLNFKNLVARNFNLKEGGTIIFTGDPLEGRIDATGAYNVKASLASLGIQVDSTAASSTNVNVECLIHLKDALLNPTLTFGMNLPNASEDITQTVYALIDTTNQAVMTSQALSLLVLGTFSYAGNSANNNSTNYIDALTNNLLGGMNLDITDNVNIGLQYHSGSSSSSYDEYQINMRSEFLENRLTIETNFGVITNSIYNSGGASNLVGEFDMYYKLTRDGRLQGHFYNHSNYNSNFSSFAFDRLAPYTQGLGVTYSRSFDKFNDLLKRKKSLTPNGGPMIDKPKGKETP